MDTVHEKFRTFGTFEVHSLSCLVHVPLLFVLEHNVRIELRSLSLPWTVRATAQIPCVQCHVMFELDNGQLLATFGAFAEVVSSFRMRSPLVDFQPPCPGKALLANVAPEPVREVNDVGVRVSVVVVLKHLVAMPALHLQLLVHLLVTQER